MSLHRYIRVSISALCCSVVLSIAVAQTHPPQQLLPFDREGQVLILDRDLNLRYTLFDTTGFTQAMLFQTSDTTWSAEIVSTDGSGMKREARQLNKYDIETIRDKVHLKSTAEPPIAGVLPLDDEGEGSDLFVQSATGMTIAWYGWTLPAIIGSSESPVGFSLYLLTGAIGYLGASRFAETRTLSTTQGYAFQYYASRSVIMGYGLHNGIAGSWTTSRTGVPFATVASLGAGYWAMNRVATSGWSYGQVKTVGVFGDAGILLGIGTAYVMAKGDPGIFKDGGDNPRKYGFAAFGGGLGGLLLGSHIAGSGKYSPGDADIQEASGFIGAFVGFTLVDLADQKSTKFQIGGSMAGFVAGHVVGSSTSRSYSLTKAQGRKVSLLTSAGILLGLGVAELVGSKERDRTIYLTLGTLGAAAGFLGSLPSSSGDTGAKLQGTNLSIHPDGLVAHVRKHPLYPVAITQPAVRLTFVL